VDVATEPSISYSITVRLELPAGGTAISRLTTCVEEAGGIVTALDVTASGHDKLRIDVTCAASDTAHADRIVEALREIEGVDVHKVSDRTFLMHLGGSIQMESKHPIRNRDDLSMVYTPGVARICQAIAANPEDARRLTVKRNSVAVVTDGSAVLGLGNIGPAAALPVMEGKAALFKRFAGIDAWPLCLDTQDPDLILDIPVFHDDQHGTAIVVLAALTNALRVVEKKLQDVRIVMSGAGAAGTAILRLLMEAGARDVVVADVEGVVYRDRPGLHESLYALAEATNQRGLTGSLREAVVDADVFIGVSAPHIIDGEDVSRMAKGSIVFALANPVPEIDPAEARKHAAVVATGRSDYPNQINNVLAFPGVFRGLLDASANQIDDTLLVAAAEAIAGTVSSDELNANYIIPSVFHAEVHTAVATAVRHAAEASSRVATSDAATAHV
jgi:malate dehydrogenase (oxaloacetate-decarboxylating)